MSIKRAAAIPLMRRAVDKGQSRASFLRELRTKGLTYRKTTMLGDWRSLADIEAKKDLFKYVRKDRVPSDRVIASVSWALSTEYKYLVNVASRLRPDEPIKYEVKSIMTDELLTPEAVERAGWEMIEEKYPERFEEIVSVTPIGVIRRVL